MPLTPETSNRLQQAYDKACELAAITKDKLRAGLKSLVGLTVAAVSFTAVAYYSTVFFLQNAFSIWITLFLGANLLNQVVLNENNQINTLVNSVDFAQKAKDLSTYVAYKAAPVIFNNSRKFGEEVVFEGIASTANAASNTAYAAYSQLPSMPRVRNPFRKD